MTEQPCCAGNCINATYDDALAVIKPIRVIQFVSKLYVSTDITSFTFDLSKLIYVPCIFV